MMQAISLKDLLALTTAAAISAAAPAAFAQKAAAAQVLFDEGMKLMGKGQFAAACPKLKSAQNLDPGMATQFRLAECYERLGSTASAWALYVEVAEAARAAKSPDREAFARKRAKALEPRLSRMTITVTADLRDLDGLTIRRDGVPIEKPLWGTAVPVDPGEHAILATAPGKKAWQGRRVVGEPASNLEVTIAPLEDLPSAPRVPPSVPPLETSTRRSPWPAIALVAGAVASAGAGVGLLLLASQKNKDLLVLDRQIVNSGQSCVNFPDASCETLLGTARSIDTFRSLSIGTFVGAGILALGGFTYLLWPMPKSKTTMRLEVHAAPVFSERQVSMVIWGSF